MTSAIVLAAVDMISVVAIAALVQEEGAQGDTTFTFKQSFDCLVTMMTLTTLMREIRQTTMETARKTLM